jgi:prepilin-type N-terminal cleavage/methylation domain-containing protein
MRNKGFTLVEIMIVVAILGLLAMIAIPAFNRARRKSQTEACINNLRVISDAKAQAAIEFGGATGQSFLNPSDLMMYIKGDTLPVCPVGEAAYVINPIGIAPQCSSGIADHELPNG